MNGGGSDFEITLHVTLSRRSAVEFGVIVDESQILPLFIGVLGCHCAIAGSMVFVLKRSPIFF
jgi:hypothetical protein